MLTKNTKYFTIPTSHLKLSSETVVFNLQFTHLVMNNSLDECLNTILKIAGGEQNVPSDVFMYTGVLLKKILNGFSIYSALLKTSIVDVGDIMISQECRKVLRVPDVFKFLKYCRLLHFYSTFCLHMTE